MANQSFLIRFEGVGVAQGNALAKELQVALRDVSPDVSVERKPEEEGHQDFGATLVLVLGTPVAIALARRFGDWLVKHRTVKVTIEGKGEKIVASDLTSGDAAKVIGEFLKKQE